MVKQLKADHNYWGLYKGRFPTLYEQQCGFSYVPHTTAKPVDLPSVRAHRVFSLSKKTLECLTICKCSGKGSIFSLKQARVETVLRSEVVLKNICNIVFRYLLIRESTLQGHLSA